MLLQFAMGIWSLKPLQNAKEKMEHAGKEVSGLQMLTTSKKQYVERSALETLYTDGGPVRRSKPK